jgi:hypothetical protein
MAHAVNGELVQAVAMGEFKRSNLKQAGLINEATEVFTVEDVFEYMAKLKKTLMRRFSIEENAVIGD